MKLFKHNIAVMEKSPETEGEVLGSGPISSS